MTDAVQPRAWRFVAELGALAREAQQLANHYSALLRRLADLDLKPEKETPTLFKWGGKRVYMRNLTGTMPSGGTATLMTGISQVHWMAGDALVDILGTKVRLGLKAGGDAIYPLVTVATGELSLQEAGTAFHDAQYDVTLFYTRVGG